MENLTISSNTKIIIGRESELLVGEEIKKYSNKILLHYGGGSIKKIGLYEKVVKSLKMNNIEFIELSGVISNPRVSLVREGIKICKENDISFILAIGGGSIEVTSVNGNAVNFTGAYPTVIVSNRDVPGVLSKVASILYDNDINIAFMKVFRNQKGKNATMVFEVDHEITAEIIGNIKAIEGINKVIMINPIKE